MSTSPQQLHTHIQTALAGLGAETDEAAADEAIKTYLDAISRFHHYSLHNQLLIAIQDPDATQVAGYRKWQLLGRQVKRGAKGIAILAPCIYKQRQLETDPDGDATISILTGFKVVHVFDIRHTTGEPLPQPPRWFDEQQDPDLLDNLIHIAEQFGNTVTKDLRDTKCRGSYACGHIQLAQDAGPGTLIHELAHQQLNHDRLGISHTVAETEADAVAYVVLTWMGRPADYVPNYIALHGGDSKHIQESLDRIRTVSATIINAIEGDHQCLPN